MQPVSEQCFFAALAHAGNGEVIFLAGEQADPVLIDRADLTEGDLHAAVRVDGAVEHESTGIKN